MQQCCKVMVNNSLIPPRGLSARHCRPSPAPKRRRKFNRDLRGALAECRTLLITLSVYCAAPHQEPATDGSEAALFGGSIGDEIIRMTERAREQVNISSKPACSFTPECSISRKRREINSSTVKSALFKRAHYRLLAVHRQRSFSPPLRAGDDAARPAARGG